MDEASEAGLYRLMRERLPETTIFSVGHRATLRSFHARQLVIQRNRSRSSSIFEVTTTPGSARGNLSLPIRDKVAAMAG
jgi:ABC-type uncharacterized transport system fused permease/ATPase subunit